MRYPRLKKIEEYITSRDFVSLDELSEAFGISMITVRRDVARLSEGGMFEKVYGGVRVARTPSHSMTTFSERAVRNAGEKRVIGELAAGFVENGDVVYLDSGTTTAAMLPYLTSLQSLTIVTVNIQVLYFCLNYPNIQCLTIEGSLSHNTASLAPDEKMAERLSQFNISKAFMGATGISIEKGATNQLGELPIKKKAMAHSNMRFLLADATKFDRAALLTYAALDEFQYVLSDDRPNGQYQDFFRRHEIRLISGGDKGSGE